MRNLTTLTFLIISCISFAQDWTTRAETPANSFGYGLDETVDGFIGIGTDSLLADYTSKILIVKYSKCGEIIWETLLEPYGTSEAAGVDIIALSDGNYAGMGIIGVDSIYVFKMNPAGDLIWEEIIPSTYYLPEIRVIGQINEDSDGNLYVMSKQYIFKCDEMGEVLWSKDFFAENSIYCKQFQIDPDNNALIIGLNTLTGKSDLIKCNPLGDIMFIKNTHCTATSITHLGAQIALGGYISREKFIRFFDLEGDTINTQVLPYNEDDPWLVENEDIMYSTITQIDLMMNGNLALWSNYSGYSPVSWIKSYVIEYDHATETIISETTLNDLSSTTINRNFSGDIVGSFDEGYAAIGATYSVDEDDIQMTLWKFKDNCTLGLESSKKSELKIHPNPSSDYIKIYGSSAVITASIYSIEGREIYSPKIIQNNEMDIRQLPKGVYIIQIQTSKDVSSFKFVKD